LPNDLGVFDTLGNVIEWCQDRSYTYQRERVNPSGDDIIDDIPRLLRGGAFGYRPALVRSAERDGDAPANRLIDDGFRLARTYD
jgi:formylglycine-generating enzyme required for sulfatase activity